MRKKVCSILKLIKYPVVLVLSLCGCIQMMAQPAGCLKDLPHKDTRRAFYLGFSVLNGTPVTGSFSGNDEKPESGLPGFGTGYGLLLGYEISDRWNIEVFPQRHEKYISDASLMHAMVYKNGQTMDGNNWTYSRNSGVWRLSSSLACLNYKTGFPSVKNLYLSAGISLGRATATSPSYYAFADAYYYSIGGGILYFEIKSHYKNARISRSEKSAVIGGLQSKISYSLGKRIDLTAGVECLFSTFRFRDIMYEYNNSNPVPQETYIKTPLNWTLNYASLLLGWGLNYRFGSLK